MPQVVLGAGGEVIGQVRGFETDLLAKEKIPDRTSKHRIDFANADVGIFSNS